MEYLAAAHTDAGTRRKTNQDSMIIMQAETALGGVLFASICDGMGGLDRGEAASAAMVYAFAGWFEEQLPGLIRLMEEGRFTEERLRGQWAGLIDRANRSIEAYGRSIRAALGTTAVGLLAIGGDYYTVNVGDSRAYRLSDRICQLTKDQTYVQLEMDEGLLTFEESLTHPQRSVLLQCIGAGRTVRPAFGHGKAAAGDVFMLCSDGFRHVISPDEFYEAFHPSRMTDEETMEKEVERMTRLNLERREEDNISAILVKLVADGA